MIELEEKFLSGINGSECSVRGKLYKSSIDSTDTLRSEISCYHTLKVLIMDKSWTTVEVLRQTRHDWLNKIQIIKGNLELNKIDRVKGFIEEIIIETQQEARLSSLNMPKFSELLMTANWENWTFNFEYEIVDVFEASESMDELMYQWTRSYFQLLGEQLNPFTENMLTIEVSKKEIRNMCCSFHLQGKLKEQDTVTKFLTNSLTEQQTVNVQSLSEEELFFTMDVRFE